MARAKLNSILVALIVAVGRLSAAGHDFCATSNMNFGIRVPSANHSTHWQTTFTTGFNHQPLILLEPTGIYGLRADGLNGWQKAGVEGSEFLVAALGSTFLTEGFVISSMNDWSGPLYRAAWMTGLVAGIPLYSSTATWAMGRYVYKNDEKWWESLLGAGTGFAASAALVGLGFAAEELHAPGSPQTGSYLTFAGYVGFCVLPPIGAIIGANHR